MGAPEPPMRIGNQEREEAVGALGEHYAHGRLDTEEFDRRVGWAYAARTASDLDGLFHDLPRPTPPVPLPTAPPYLTRGPAPAANWPPPAPYGWDPITGMPYAAQSKVLAGVLQLLLPIGIGRFYAGHTGLGIAQLLLSFFFVGVLWCWIDGIVMLVGRPTDPQGRPLRP